jgi:hypothetical protein
MYTNFKLIWPICTQVVSLAGNNMKNFTTFWSIFGPYFLSHFPTSEATGRRVRKSIIGQEDENENDFLSHIYQSTFGFPSELSVKLGMEENLDDSQYRVNLWKCLGGGIPLSKIEYDEIKPIIDQTIS